jgi:HK97 family phage major capsid protein
LDISGAVLPSPLDPSIVLANAGTIDPMRSVARVDQTVANTKRYITSAGVTASFDAELTETSDDSPTLTEVTITARKAQGFVQASVEAAMDQPDISEEVARMFGDAKARLEGTNFIKGAAASNQPIGIEKALDGGSSELAPATAEAFAAADVYSTLEGLPARYRANAVFQAELPTLNGIDQFETGNGAKLFPEVGSSNPVILRRRVVENSNIDALADLNPAASEDNFLLFVGDWSQYVIMDRIGMSIQYIPALLNTTTNLPDGRVG